MERSEFLHQGQEAEVRSGSSSIRAITEKQASTGKPYRVVELANGEKISVFNPKQLEGVQVGDLVNYDLKKNERGYWNFASLQKSFPQEQPGPARESSTPAPAELVHGERPMRESMDRERRMASMNALSNATTLVTTLINIGIVKPATPDAAMELVKQAHSGMLHLHELEPTSE